MSRRPAAFKQSDLTKALKAAKATGVEIARYEIEDGKITVFTGKPATTNTNSELDQWIEKHHANQTERG
jgi:hypothetical protein